MVTVSREFVDPPLMDSAILRLEEAGRVEMRWCDLEWRAAAGESFSCFSGTAALANIDFSIWFWRINIINAEKNIELR